MEIKFKDFICHRVFTSVRKIAVYIRFSLQRILEFRKLGDMTSIVTANLYVILDVETCWNATYNMLTRFKILTGFQFDVFYQR
jgi:hypothetical protein